MPLFPLWGILKITLIMPKLLEKPAFFKNPDKSHCVQACLRSIFSVTNPGVSFSWKQLEELTDYLPGHGAWVYPELLSLDRYELEAKLVTGFNIERFITEGFDYIEDEYGSDVADYEREHPHDYKKLKKQMKEALNKNLVLSREGTEKDIKDFIDDGWYVMLLVNSKALNNQKGYIGHRILLYGCDEDGYIVNDPGPSNPGESKKISWSQLNKAWQNGKELIAVKSRKLQK